MKRKEIHKLDLKWSKMVREIGKCECCLENNEHLRLSAAHIKGRRYRGTRWGAIIDDKYDSCGICLCHICHQQYDEHGSKHDFIKNVVIGEVRYYKIQQIAEKAAKYQDYEEINMLLGRG